MARVCICFIMWTRLNASHMLINVEIYNKVTETKKIKNTQCKFQWTFWLFPLMTVQNLNLFVFLLQMDNKSFCVFGKKLFLFFSFLNAKNPFTLQLHFKLFKVSTYKFYISFAVKNQQKKKTNKMWEEIINFLKTKPNTRQKKKMFICNSHLKSNFN